jgi:hypothetical protein
MKRKRHSAEQIICKLREQEDTSRADSITLISGLSASGEIAFALSALKISRR